jgi:uncharacterized protein (UPF0332 family)
MNERIKFPDVEKAKSIINSAKDDINYTLKLKISKESANTIIRNIYESFRMLGEALLIKKGVEFSDHINSINELLKINIDTPRPIQTLENLRKLRHKINYQGYKAKIEEVEEALSIANSNFNALLKKIKEIIEK